MTVKDIVARLRADHRHIESLLERANRATGQRAWDVFWELTNELVRHEVAEEIVVYPVVRNVVPNGERLADARIKEQAAAEELLAQIEREGPDSTSLGSNLEKLQKAVLEHATKEEDLILAPLADRLEADRKRSLGEMYDAAKATAPTHPHPNAPDTPPGNLVAGPVAALVDRARDAMHRLAS